jgi:SET domain-containing protein
MISSDTHGLCIPYVVRIAPNKGHGLFAEAAIPKGTTVWRHVAGQYAVYDERSLKALLSNLPNSEALYVLEHIYCMPEFPEYMIRVFDDGELTNHSDQPTLLTHTRPGYDEVLAATSTKDVSSVLLGNHFTLVAARDIEEGEELPLTTTMILRIHSITIRFVNNMALHGIGYRKASHHTDA